MFIILVNDGIYGGNKVYKTFAEVESVIKEWSGGEELVDEDDEVVSIDDLLLWDKEIWNERMVERGDEFITLGITELHF